MKFIVNKYQNYKYFEVFRAIPKTALFKNDKVKMNFVLHSYLFTSFSG